MIPNEQKQTISVSDGFEPLQMISKADTGWCASENARPPRWVDGEISHRLKKGTKHSL